MTRTFEDKPAARERTPLLLGLVGPSGSGKTYSALRLATGIQRVTKGDIYVIDTEARRALHYADRFKFRHVAFGAPFSPLDYLAAIEHCVKKGATTIVVDSMSHEHEGVGGVLEMHEAEHKRLGGSEKTKLLAWGAPKRARRRLINTILQMPVNFVFCFRAKEKLKIEKGKDPEKMGFQAVSGEEWIYEMSAKCLLHPGAGGVPTWQSDLRGEREVIKCPEQFRSIFMNGQAYVLSEDVGQRLAEWAVGAPVAAPVDIDELLRAYAACSDAATLRALEATRQASWPKLSKADKEAAKEAAVEARERVEAAEAIGAEEDADDDEQANGGGQ